MGKTAEVAQEGEGLRGSHGLTFRDGCNRAPLKLMAEAHIADHLFPLPFNWLDALGIFVVVEFLTMRPPD